jgi:hypothetical protein
MGLTHLHCNYQIICEPFTPSSMLQCWSQPHLTPSQTEFNHRLLLLLLTASPSLKSQMFSTLKLTNDARLANCCTSYNGQAMKAPMKKHHGSLLPNLTMHPNLCWTFTSHTRPSQAPYILSDFIKSIDISLKEILFTLHSILPSWPSSHISASSYFLSFLSSPHLPAFEGGLLPLTL